MSNIVFLRSHLPVPEDADHDAPKADLAQLIENSGLPDLLRELEEKLDVMLSYVAGLETPCDAGTDEASLS